MVIDNASIFGYNLARLLGYLVVVLTTFFSLLEAVKILWILQVFDRRAPKANENPIKNVKILICVQEIKQNRTEDVLSWKTLKYSEHFKYNKVNVYCQKYYYSIVNNCLRFLMHPLLEFD